MGLTALGALVVTTCKVTDVLTSPGVGSVSLAYGGASRIVVGSSVRASATAAVNGQALARARFEFISSDSGVVAVRGDSLVARARGGVTLTIRLASSILPSDPPSITQALDVVVDTVTVDSASVTFASLGDTVTLASEALDANGNALAGVRPAWSTSDTAIVGVTSSGRIQAKRNGTATVRAVVDFDTVAVPVTVQQVLDRYTFDPGTLRIDALAASGQATATGRDARGVAMAGVAPLWSIGDGSLATINAFTGVVTSLLNGSTFLYATRGTVTDSVALVIAQKATTVFISPDPVPPLISIGDQTQLTARAFDRRSVELQGAAPAWFTLNPAVLRVSTEGLVTGLGIGSGRVVATLDGATDTVTVTVGNDPATVTITPDTAVAASVGDTVQFTATVRNGRGDVLTAAAAPVTWGSLNPSIATVLADGRAIANVVGTARVVASAGGKADTAVAVVTNAVALLAIVPTSRTLTSLGDTVTPATVIRNARGVDLSNSAVTWSVDETTIARVSVVGLITARDTGVTIVRATAGALTDSLVLTVRNDAVSLAIQGRALDTLTALGQQLTYTIEARNARGALIPNAAVLWRSVNRAVVDTVAADGVATAIGFGSTLLIVSAGTSLDTVFWVVRNPTRLIVDNAVVANPRFGTQARPYARIQDAVNAADANDTVIVRAGTGGYAETVALSRRLTLLGDSGAFLLSGRNAAALPLIAHDTGAAAITAITTAPQTIRYLAVRHSLDGPALDAVGADVVVQDFAVNPAGLGVTARIGRGISIRNSPSGSRVERVTVDSVRAYGIRLENVSLATVTSNVVAGVDSLAGEEGAGVKVLNGVSDVVSKVSVRGAQVGILVTGASLARVDSNLVSRNAVGMRLDGRSDFAASINDIYDNDSSGVVNPLPAVLLIPNNWWGDSRGPRRSAQLNALGDSAVGSITFSPARGSALFTGATAAGIRLVRGSGQTATRGTTLPLALSVRVVSAAGLPVSGASVTFTVTGGGGLLGGVASVIKGTDGSGLAETAFTLGGTAGANSVTATISGAAVTIAFVTFTATGTP